MAQTAKRPPLGKGDLSGMSSFDGDDTQLLAQNPAPAQEICREMLRQNIADNVELLISQLDAAMAMGRVPNDAGFVYGLRCAQAHWRSIAADAKELASLRRGART